MVERIPESNWQEWDGHLYRYRLAADWLQEGERVLDVACGIGYGAQLIAEAVQVDYLGIDRVIPSATFAPFGRFIGGVDLDTWQPDQAWDVTISFETLEHVQHPDRLAQHLKAAERLIILSTPTRPTKHLNPYHLHDFTVDQVLQMFDDWNLLDLEDQPDELSHIFVWGRP